MGNCCVHITSPHILSPSPVMEYVIRDVVHQGKLTDVLHKIFSGKSTGFYLELDLWLPDLNISFEFQDPHHYVTTAEAQIPLAEIQQKDAVKREVVHLRGETLVVIPCWWTGSEESLISTIQFHRPDLMCEKKMQEFPIPLNPISSRFQEVGVPGIGELMLASIPVSLQFSTALSASPWWLGEKYDGLRACWQPVLLQLYTRSGVRVSLPKSFSVLFGKRFLDCEVWFGRGNFEETQTMIRLTSLDLINWPLVRFLAFDDPSVSVRALPFEHRFKKLLKAVSFNHPFIRVVSRMKCKDPVAIEGLLRNIIEDGGEGIIMRKLGSYYESGRSPALLKLKAVRGDREALVLSDEHDGVCTLQLPDGVTFKAEKELNLRQQLKEGDVVSISFENYSRNAIPVDPKIYRKRTDVEWSYVLRTHREDVPQSLAYSGDTQKVFKSETKPLGYWVNRDNVRALLEKYAQSLNFNPLVPDNWYPVTQADFVKFKGGISALHQYKGSIVKALIDTFPEIGLDITKFAIMPQSYWHSLENRRGFLLRFATEKGFDPLVALNWYPISLEQILHYKGGVSLMGLYSNRPTVAFSHIFPEISLDINQFDFVPMDYWHDINNRRMFFNSLAKDYGFDPLVASNWHSVTQRQILAAKKGTGILNYYRGFGGFKCALMDVYPHIGFDGASTPFVQHAVLEDTGYRRKIFQEFALYNKFDPLVSSNWYTVTREKFTKWKNAAKVLKLYKNSLYDALVDAFPELVFMKSSFVRSPSILRSSRRKTFIAKEKVSKSARQKASKRLLTREGYTQADERRAVFDQFAKSRGFDPLLPDNWYSITSEAVLSFEELIPVLTHYKGSFVSAVLQLYAGIGLDIKKFSIFSEK